MASTDLKEVNNTFIQLNNDSFSPSALVDLMNAMDALSDEVIAKQMDAMATVNQLRVKNEERIFALDKKHQEEMLAESIRQQQAVIDKKREATIKLLEKERDAELLKTAELGEEKRKEAEKAILKEFETRRDQENELAEFRKKESEKLTALEHKKKLENIKKAAKQEAALRSKNLFATNASWEEKKEAWKSIGKGHVDENGNEVGRSAVTIADDLIKGLASIAKQLNNQIESIAGKKGAIDTRLQGSRNSTSHGSYWERMSSDIVGLAGVSPFIKQSTVVDRVTQMVDKGIAFNVEQRAMLDILKDKIATTFDATNATLLRLVRVQQQDTTAARLGMESALTSFLNNMYETTEYMRDLANSVKGSLEEAMSLMSGENALSFEYQVQKWMGSLYSVGMNQSSVQSLAGVVGQIAAGQLEGLTNGKGSNLAIMAANRAGLSIADMMAQGLDESSTNKLMTAMVDYLAEIYNETKDSKVIQQQYAGIFGLTASDLRSVANLSRSTAAVSKNGLNYDQAIGRLYNMAGSMYKRTSQGEMMSNMKDNVMYSMAAGIANSPFLYALNTASNLLDTFVGGLPIPFINTMFGGVDLHTSVADLMRVGAFSGGILSSLGKMLTGGTGGGFSTTGILNKLGVKDTSKSFVTRGTGAGLTTLSGLMRSSSGTTASNSSSDDIVNKTMGDATDSNNSKLAEATNDQDEITIKDVDTHVLEIVDLLESVIHGNEAVRVIQDSTAGIWRGPY